MRQAAYVVLALVALSGAVWAQDLPGKQPGHEATAPPNAPGRALRPAGDLSIVSDVSVGDKAPDFALEGSLPGKVRLSDLKGQWVVVVFDEDRAKLGGFNDVNRSLTRMGVRLYGVCRDGSGALKSFAERGKLSYPLLSDPTGEVSKLYGMYDSGNEAIQPGMALLDPKGIVRALWTGPSLHGLEVLQLVRHSVMGA